MKKGIVKILLFVLGVVVILSLVSYISAARIFNLTEKLIIENTGIAQFEPEIIKPHSLPSNEVEAQKIETPQGVQTNPVTPSTKPKKEIQEDNIPKKTSGTEKLSSNISFEDKRRILQLVAKNLKTEDIKYLASLLSGELTPEKKQSAVELALKRFEDEDIKELQMLFEKYKDYAF